MSMILVFNVFSVVAGLWTAAAALVAGLSLTDAAASAREASFAWGTTGLAVMAAAKAVWAAAGRARGSGTGS